MGTVPSPNKHNKQYVNIVSQNTRGLSEDKEEELINSWKKRNVFAGCLQETWRAGGLTQWENNGFVFIHNGLAEKPCSRGAQGVAVVLGPENRQGKLGKKLAVYKVRFWITNRGSKIGDSTVGS